ncbi:MAG: thermonuclease family protein [Bacillota bacterium]
MKKIMAALSLLFLLAGCGVNERTPGKGEKWVKVSRVIDGDTFEIINSGKKERVRMIGIDTPETVKPGAKVEPLGPEASSYTKKAIEGKKVRIELDVQERDKYGRILAYVYLEDGALLNARLLEEGLAVIMTVPPNVRMADDFYKLQKNAREHKKGVWK